MIPIHQLLSRIRWDKTFADAEFALGYYDRVADKVIVVPFAEVTLVPDDKFAFEVMDREGELHSVPYHRVRDVYRNDELIWHRDG
ncbi:MAG: DUF504 domain-containing protein [Pseudomonadota bacterium]|nr:MAG: DUF504 domain-containing protein [Pseudomonadota bacterium]